MTSLWEILKIYLDFKLDIDDSYVILKHVDETHTILKRGKFNEVAH